MPAMPARDERWAETEGRKNMDLVDSAEQSERVEEMGREAGRAREERAEGDGTNNAEAAPPLT